MNQTFYTLQQRIKYSTVFKYKKYIKSQKITIYESNLKKEYH